MRAPAVLLELAFHDNPEDAAWIKANLDRVARSLVLSLTEFFEIPFFETEDPRPGVVDVTWGALNIRARPDRTRPRPGPGPGRGAPHRPQRGRTAGIWSGTTAPWAMSAATISLFV